jgi:hypothetical protein
MIYQNLIDAAASPKFDFPRLRCKPIIKRNLKQELAASLKQLSSEGSHPKYNPEVNCEVADLLTSVLEKWFSRRHFFRAQL